MREIKAYMCEYCEKILKTRSGIKKHEDKCFANPREKACRTCENFYSDDWNETHCDVYLKSFSKKEIKYKKNCQNHRRSKIKRW